MPQQKHANIRRKDEIPDDVRTDGKDEAAQIIQTLIDRGDWPVSLSDVADNCDWSRSHLQNTVRDYFEHVEEDNNIDLDTSQDNSQKMPSVRIPDDVENVETYLRGVATGYSLSKGREEAV